MSNVQSDGEDVIEDPLFVRTLLTSRYQHKFSDEAFYHKYKASFSVLISILLYKWFYILEIVACGSSSVYMYKHLHLHLQLTKVSKSTKY